MPKMKTYISIMFLLSAILSLPIECKEAAYVTVADESGYTQIAVIDLDNPQIVEYIPLGHNATFGNIILNTDGKSLLLAGYRSDKIYQIDIETNTVIDSMAQARPYRIALTPDGKYLLSSDDRAGGNKVSIINWIQKKIVLEVGRENNFISKVLITPDGRLAYIHDIDSLRVVDMSTIQKIKTVASPNLRSLIWHKRQGLLYAIDEENQSIAKIDSSSHQIIDRINLDIEGTLNHIRFNCCENKLLISTDLAHHIIDMETKKTIWQMSFSASRQSRAVDISFTPNGKQIYLTTPVLQAIDAGSSTPGKVRILSTEQSAILYQLDIGFQPSSIAMVTYPPPMLGDFNSDRQIAFEDFILFASAFGTDFKDEHWDCKYDLISNGHVDFADFIQFVRFLLR